PPRPLDLRRAGRERGRLRPRPPPLRERPPGLPHHRPLPDGRSRCDGGRRPRGPDPQPAGVLLPVRPHPERAPAQLLARPGLHPRLSLSALPRALLQPPRPVLLPVPRLSGLRLPPRPTSLHGDPGASPGPARAARDPPARGDPAR